MFDTVMVAIDGSPYSNEALVAAGGIAARAGCHVEVVHVHEHDLIPGKSGVALDLESVDDAQALVDKAVESLAADGITAKGRLLRAQTRDVPRAIIEAAKESGADLIIVGRRGLLQPHGHRLRKRVQQDRPGGDGSGHGGALGRPSL